MHEATSSSIPEYMIAATPRVIRSVLQRLQDLMMPGDLFSDEEEVSLVIAWLDDICAEGDFFRAWTVKVLSEVDDTSGTAARGRGESFLVRFASLDDELVPGAVAQDLHTFYFHLLIVPEFKRIFLEKHFLPFYKNNIERYITGEREKDVFSEFTVQLFTSPNLVDILLKENTLELVLDKLHETITKALTDRVKKPRTKKKKEKEGTEETTEGIYCTPRKIGTHSEPQSALCAQ